MKGLFAQPLYVIMCDFYFLHKNFDAWEVMQPKTRSIIEKLATLIVFHLHGV